jgi:4-hydroxy-2-oxoheptanedioate aldolase
LLLTELDIFWSQMMKTKLRDTWTAGNAAINGWLAIPNGIVAELTSKAGYDSIVIDLQHGLNDYASALECLQAMQASDVTPMARVPWLEPGILMKLLDAGAMGIICPMINTAEDAENFVRYASYAPRGTRSFGPTRAAMAHGADYWTKANKAVVTLAMIETTQAVDNLDAIVATPDLTGVYIGPSDLALSMGYTPKLDQEEPAVVEKIEYIRKTAHAAGLKTGIHCAETSYAKRMIADGFDLVTLGSDMRMLTTAYATAMSEMRG